MAWSYAVQALSLVNFYTHSSMVFLGNGALTYMSWCCHLAESWQTRPIV